MDLLEWIFSMLCVLVLVVAVFAILTYGETVRLRESVQYTNSLLENLTP